MTKCLEFVAHTFLNVWKRTFYVYRIQDKQSSEESDQEFQHSVLGIREYLREKVDSWESNPGPQVVR